MTPYQIGRKFFLERGRKATPAEMRALVPAEVAAHPLAHSAWVHAFWRAQSECRHDTDQQLEHYVDDGGEG